MKLQKRLITTSAAILISCPASLTAENQPSSAMKFLYRYEKLADEMQKHISEGSVEYLELNSLENTACKSLTNYLDGGL